MDVSSGRVERGLGLSQRKREGEKTRERDVLFYILGALWGFVTPSAVLPFSAVPFGFAAIAVPSRYLIGVAAGAVLSGIVTHSYELIAAYAVVLLCRLAFSSIRVGENRTRLFCEHPAARAVSAATGALALGIYRLVSSGFLYYDVVGMVLTMALSALLVPLWYTAVPRQESEVGGNHTALRTAGACSMAALTVYALSGAFIWGISLSVFAALLITLFAVRHKGVSYGVLIAICTGVFTSVTYAPLFILAAVSFALLLGVSVGLASFSTVAVGMAWGIYMTGIAALSEVFPGIFAASVIFTVLDKLFFPRDSSAEKAFPTDESLAEESDVAQRMGRLCSALTSLSESISLAEKKLEAPIEAHRRTSGGSLSAVIDGERAIVKRKSAKKQAVGEVLECRESFDGGAYSGAYAAYLAAISDCISSVVSETQSAEVLGAQKPPLEYSLSGRRKSAPSERKFCGDSFDAVRGQDKNLYAFISDGMGSGREAAHASEICAAFLRELLGAGVAPKTAFKMLNGFLRIGNFESASECTATADIANIDLYRAKVRFYKSGAASSFIFHDGEVKRIFARTMPLGLMSDADVAVCESEIFAGDVIVMLSDGVTEGREECPELCEFIRTRRLTHSADQLADAIISYTQKRGTQDDVSVIVIKIEQSEFAK